jgi:hypothetical protein
MYVLCMPTNCAECGEGVQFIKRPRAPGGMAFTCSNHRCRYHGKLYEIPQLRAERLIEASLLRKPAVGIA